MMMAMYRRRRISYSFVLLRDGSILLLPLLWRERVSSSWPRSQRRRNAMILFVHIYL